MDLHKTVQTPQQEKPFCTPGWICVIRSEALAQCTKAEVEHNLVLKVVTDDEHKKDKSRL